MGSLTSSVTLNNMASLIDACRKGDIDIVRSLLAAEKADVNVKDDDGVPALHLAVYNNHVNIVNILLDNSKIRLENTSANNKGTALHGACYFNHFSIIEVIAKHERFTQELLNMKNKDGETAVHVSVKYGYLEGLKTLAEVPGVDFNSRNGKGQTLMEVATEKNYQEILEFLQMKNMLSA